MKPINRSPGERYGLALVAVAIGFLIRWAAAPWIEVETPFLLYLVVVIFSAWSGGKGPGILATVLLAGLGSFLILTPAPPSCCPACPKPCVWHPFCLPGWPSPPSRLTPSERGTMRESARLAQCCPRHDR